MKRMIAILCLLLGIFPGLRAEQEEVRDVQDSLHARLVRAAALDAAWRSEVDLSVGEIRLSELFRTLADVNGVNLCVKTDDSRMVSCNFKRARVTDLLEYLCREYEMEVELWGNILTVYTAATPPDRPRVPQISYEKEKRKISYDLCEDTLSVVMKKMTELTGINIIVPEAVRHLTVSGFATRLPVDEAIPFLAAANGLEAMQGKQGIWTLQAMGEGSALSPIPHRFPRAFAADEIRCDSLGRVYISVSHGHLQDIITELCRLRNVDRMFLCPLEKEVSIYAREVGFDTLLEVLFAGTPYTCRRENNICIFGSTAEDKSLNSVAVLPLRFRTVEKVPDLIPESLKSGMQIQVFPDQNSLIVAGSSRQVEQIRQFLEDIDLSVPLVTIEVLIVNSHKTNVQEVGITAGLGDKPVATSGRISPGIDMMLSAASVNHVINSLNGFGSVNLGKVTPNFYMSLKALEEAGTLELRSTPKLSTLNGHEASLKSGETQYYKEVQNNIIGTQNPLQTESYQWKSVEASLSVSILPYVSRDRKITLTVEISQSEFTAREEKSAPPGTATRSFKAQIRVENGDMVLLGGIERNSHEKNSSGLPFLARVPVLKWLFGSSKNNKVEEKLNLFIKPTVVF